MKNVSSERRKQDGERERKQKKKKKKKKKKKNYKIKSDTYDYDIPNKIAKEVSTKCYEPSQKWIF